MQVKIKLINNGRVPKKQTEGSAGYDLYSNADAALMPGEFKLIPLGICIELPKGFEAQIRPRSGMALKYGVTVLNTPGTIDSDYNLEISVLLINLGKETYHVKKYDRIAQMVISKYENIDFELSEEIKSNTRFGGWGSSGENDLAI